MGQMKHEGQAVDVVSPGGAVEIFKGELYRIDGWTGIAMSHVLPTDPELGFALEVSLRIWYITVPTGLTTPVRGDLLYWTAGAGIKKGSADLTATVTGAPVAKVEEAPDANHVCAIRVLNAA